LKPPKILLVTWTPPGNRNVGEIILRDLCTLLPPESVCVVEVSDFPAQSSPYPTLRLPAPKEAPWRPLPGRVGGLCNYLKQRSFLKRAAKGLVAPIAEFARQQGADRIWLTLSTQALIALGVDLQRELGLPLLSLVWDPPEFLARHQGWDSASIRWTRRNFDAALRASERAMVVSENMVKSYNAQFGLPCVIVRHAFADELAGAPLQGSPDRDDATPFRIGFAGTLYDPGQLDALVAALNLLGWEIRGRPVTLRIVGNRYRFTGLTQPARVELMGWRGTEETRRLLAECDFCYLPVPFTPHFVEFAQFAFPTKLSTYFGAGRPVLVHAPEYAEPVGFCRSQGFGEVCTSMSAEHLREAVLALSDPERSASYRTSVERTLSSHFTRSVMRRQFSQFIGVEEAALGC